MDHYRRRAEAADSGSRISWRSDDRRLLRSSRRIEFDGRRVDAWEIMSRTMHEHSVPIEALEVSAYTIPTDRRESDGTYVWIRRR